LFDLELYKSNKKQRPSVCTLTPFKLTPLLSKVYIIKLGVQILRMKGGGEMEPIPDGRLWSYHSGIIQNTNFISRRTMMNRRSRI